MKKKPLKTKRRSSSRPTYLDIQKSVVTLREGVSYLVLDAARLWRKHKNLAGAPALLDSAVSILERSDALLDKVLEVTPSEGESLTPEPVTPEPAAPALVTIRRLLAPGTPEAAAPAKRARRGSHDSKGRTRR